MDKIKEKIKCMTLKEKIGQLTQCTFVISDIEKTKERIRKGEIGSVILSDTPYAGNEVTECASLSAINELQRTAMEEGNGIPIISGRDVIHGYGVIFPIPLGMAATFNRELTEKLYAYTAQAASSDGIHWTFAPMLDVSRDARWGRIAESPGEDSYLGEQYARAAVRGLQGNNSKEQGKIAACAKHFIGYGASEGGRDYNKAEISDYTLRNDYLRAFKGAVDEGLLTVMSAFNEISGQPISSSRYHLTELLKKELGFDGFIVSDWGAISQLQLQGVAKDKKECAELSINAGLDMDMVDNCYLDYLEELVNEGKVDISQVDDSVERILRVKEKLGLFDNPYVNIKKPNQNEFLDVAKRAALESIVLLKNANNILPLQKSGKYSLYGPLAEAKKALLGTWVPDPDMSLVDSIKDALEKVSSDVLWSTTKSPLPEEFFRKIDESDAVIMILGEGEVSSGEGRCLANIELSPSQQELVKHAKICGKPVIGVILAGRPLALNSVINCFDALLYAWHGGTKAAEAIADILFGNACPSGKMPVSMPRVVGQIPLYYNQPPAARKCNLYYDKATGIYSYEDCPGTPLYQFGYGLSYTEFEYSNVICENKEISYDDLKNGKRFFVSVDVKNIGKMKGQEIVQCYIHDLYASMTRPLRELRGFEKIELECNEKKTVVFELGFDELAFYNKESEFDAEIGEFEIFIGKNSTEYGGMVKVKIY